MILKHKDSFGKSENLHSGLLLIRSEGLRNMILKCKKINNSTLLHPLLIWLIQVENIYSAYF